jgi:hypothetical protein
VASTVDLSTSGLDLMFGMSITALIFEPIILLVLFVTTNDKKVKKGTSYMWSAGTLIVLQTLQFIFVFLFLSGYS